MVAIEAASVLYYFHLNKMLLVAEKPSKRILNLKEKQLIMPNSGERRNSPGLIICLFDTFRKRKTKG